MQPRASLPARPKTSFAVLQILPAVDGGTVPLLPRIGTQTWFLCGSAASECEPEALAALGSKLGGGPASTTPSTPGTNEAKRGGQHLTHIRKRRGVSAATVGAR
jgi:hypothetical protein